ncbi:IPIL1 protein, partial [Thinocorus orbignyianus]|nr:IPIL1 protein [Thinocorus orbignyianus]
WSVQENSITYSLWVCLRPPPGHSFIMEMDTTGQVSARSASVHVGLECICETGQLMGKSLCFLHPPDNRDESSYFVRTLCTDSRLDLEKVACWVQMLVRKAWLLLPESQHCQLTVLPSSHSCKFQLTGISEVDTYSEIRFAVERGSSGTHSELCAGRR